MKYNQIEQEVLSLMDRTDFKNISKNEIISIVSKLGELPPDVAKDIIANFPDLVDLMKTAITEYKGMIDSIISSDDASIKEYYGITNKELDNARESRKLFYEYAKLLQLNCTQMLENPNLTYDQAKEILDKQIEILKIIGEKDTEIRQFEKEVEESAYQKDSEKRAFNWKLAGGVSLAVITVVGGGVALLSGGKFDIKPFKK